MQWYESFNWKLCSGFIAGKLEKSCCKPCQNSTLPEVHHLNFIGKILLLKLTPWDELQAEIYPTGWGLLALAYTSYYIYNLERSTTPSFWFTINIKPVRIQLFVNEKVIIIENHRLLWLTLFIPHRDGWNNNWPLPAITFKRWIYFLKDELLNPLASRGQHVDTKPGSGVLAKFRERSYKKKTPSLYWVKSLTSKI